MSIFDRLDRMTSRVVDKTFSTRFECRPMSAPPNGRPKPDPDRGAWPGRGVLEENAGLADVQIGARRRSGNDFQNQVTGSTIELSVDRSKYSQASQVKQGDLLVMDDMRTFQVTSVKPDGMSRVVFQLVGA